MSFSDPDKLVIEDEEGLKNIREFMQVAKKLESGMFVNRNYAFLKTVKDTCLIEAQKLLGEEYLFLQKRGNRNAVASYLRKAVLLGFGERYATLFTAGNVGEQSADYLCDIEHAIFAYYWLVSEQHPNQGVYLGLLYYIYGLQLDEEFKRLSELAPNNILKPKFVLDARNFGWRKCPEIFRSYMLQLTVPDGYKGYYFEKSTLAHTMYLVHHGDAFDSAEQLALKSNHGLFYKFLPRQVESRLVPYITRGFFPEGKMDGKLADKFLADEEALLEGLAVNSTYNVYNLKIKPYMVEYMGRMAKLIASDLSQGAVKDDLARFSLLTPQRVAVVVKDGFELEEVLPAASKYLKPISDISLQDILPGGSLFDDNYLEHELPVYNLQSLNKNAETKVSERVDLVSALSQSTSTGRELGDTISINELLPSGKTITEILTGSELLLAYELDKYTRISLNKRLVLSDVSISQELLNGKIFSFVVREGLGVGFVPDLTALVDYHDIKGKLVTDTKELIFAELTQGDIIKIDDSEDSDLNRLLRGDKNSAMHVSLVAYLMVRSMISGLSMPRLCINRSQTLTGNDYVDILILYAYGNKILEGIVEISFPTGQKLQPELEAFVWYHRQRGLMNRAYSIVEKYNYMKMNFEVGDVVLFYSRKNITAKNSIGVIKKCYPAVISGIDESGISLTHYPVFQTLATRKIELDSIDQKRVDNGKERLYTYDDYFRFAFRKERFSYTEIGTNVYTFDEGKFVVHPIDTDGTYQYIKGQDESLQRVWLSTLDTIYAVFEDRKVEYNKKKFLQKNFYSVNRTPQYDILTGLKKNIEISSPDEERSFDSTPSLSEKEGHSETATIEVSNEYLNSKRGGKRTGAGRKSLGIKKSVTLSLPEEIWNEIDVLIQSGSYKSCPDYIRSLILQNRGK